MGRDCADREMTRYYDAEGQLRDEATGELCEVYEGSCECGFMTSDPAELDAHILAPCPGSEDADNA